MFTRAYKSTTYQIFCIYWTLENKWEYNGTEHQLFVDLKKAYMSQSGEKYYITFLLSMVYVRR